jgi:stearoyl-CoA desaturase (delta-9 desaturase)
MNYQFGWLELFLLVAGYYVANISVGVGLHRLWSHDTYKTNKYVEFILAIFTAGTLQGPALSWASNHFKHHAHTDTEDDPHSSLKYKNKLFAFFWSHLGWMLSGDGSFKSIDRVTMVKLGRNKILRWQLKHYWAIAAIMNTIVPALVGFCLGGTLLSAYAGYIFIGLGRIFQQQATFCVNSLCHFIGKRDYYKGTAGDIWWMAIFLLGENWHNFHHAFPSDYRNGAKWHHFDVHKWIIYAMSKLGLAWDLKTTSKIRIEARVAQVIKQSIKLKEHELSTLQKRVNFLVENLQIKFNDIENLSVDLKNKMLNSLSNTQNNLNSIKSQLTKGLKNLDSNSEKFVVVISKQVEKAEDAIKRLNLEYDNIKLRKTI